MVFRYSIRALTTIYIFSVITILFVSIIPISFADVSLTPKNWFGFTYPSQLTYDAAIWDAAIEKGSKWGFTVYRVPFLFSNYDLDKLNKIVDLIGSHGGKVILDFHCLKQYTTEPDLIGSGTWYTNWMIIANHYANSDIVIGYELANEPSLSCRFIGYTSNKDLANLLYLTARNIHNINPNKYIVFPPCNFLLTSDYAQNMKGLNSVVSIHPYSYGSKSNWEDLKVVADYRFGAQIKGWDDVFDYCWMGEIECHPQDSGGATTLDLEMQYVSYVLNQSISKGFGFCYWKYNYNTDDGGANQDTVISQSGFTPNNTNTNTKPIDNPKPIVTEKSLPDPTPAPETVSSGLSETINTMIAIIPIFGLFMMLGVASGRVNIKGLLGFIITIVILAVISNSML